MYYMDTLIDYMYPLHVNFFDLYICRNKLNESSSVHGPQIRLFFSLPCIAWGTNETFIYLFLCVDRDTSDTVK
jgi:hypothetical protein